MTNSPAKKLRDGLLTATIWENTGDDGKTRYSIELSRSYNKDGQWFETNSYSPQDVLKLSVLAHAAYAEVSELRSQKAESEAA